MFLHLLDPYAGDAMRSRPAAFAGRAGNHGQTERKKAVAQPPNNVVRKLQLNSTILRKIGSAQLDRVEGHGDLLNRQSGTLERDRHFVF